MLCVIHILYNLPCRDCLCFAFMDILQVDIRKMWNTHLIRKSRYLGGVTGIPNELFYLPGIQGYLW